MDRLPVLEAVRDNGEDEGFFEIPEGEADDLVARDRGRDQTVAVAAEEYEEGYYEGDPLLGEVEEEPQVPGGVEVVDGVLRQFRGLLARWPPQMFVPRDGYHEDEEQDEEDEEGENAGSYDYLEYDNDYGPGWR